MDLVAGIDSGSTTTKAIVLDRQERIIGFAILPTGADSRDASQKALARVLEETGVGQKDLAFVVATGYGREIASEAKGTVTREAIRMAVGQLLDYSRFVDQAKLAVLLPEVPREDLLSFLRNHSIAVIVPRSGGLFEMVPAVS